TPTVVMRPILPGGSVLVNQRLPSGPAVMADVACTLPAGSSKDVITPAVVMRPMKSFRKLVNQMFPSGPAVIPNGRATLPAGSANVVIAPAVVDRPVPFFAP